MDYGHPLQLGVLLPATTAAVELAVLAEELGLDLVALPDAPDGAEAWTLLSWVAGRTRRIGLAPAALDATARTPAVVARSTASLDLLSRGRVTLALDGDPVDALEEAVDVVRGTWDAAAPTPLTYRGEHHRLAGAQRGPAPAHTVPVWLGGGGRDALDLVGRAADGWLVPPATSPAALRDGNALVDVAATSAGRDPREVRRVLTVDVAGSVDDLLGLVVDDGVGTLLLATDDAAVLERFARELAQALREAVARERARRGTAPAPARSSAVRAARRPRIAYDDVPTALADHAVEPGDARYAAVRSTYLREGTPGLVLRPGTVEEVGQALRFARTQDVPLSLRSAGHGVSGRSTNDGGIVLDLSRMNGIEVLDDAERLVRLGPGARWGEVAAALQPRGWAISSGDYGGVGVGGLATTGGIGFLGRAHGLTIDHVRAVEMVLADGSVVRASEAENTDLFWAARGAGFTVGVVTAFELQAAEVGDVGVAQLVFDASDTAEFLTRWGAAVEAAPRELTSFLMMGAPRGGQVLAQTTTVIDSADPATILAMLQPFAQIAPLVGQSVQVAPYAAVVATPDAAHAGQGEPVTRSGLLEHVTPQFAADAERLVRSGHTFFFQIRATGGAAGDVAPDATAFAHRSANFSVVAFGSSRRNLDAVWDGMHHHSIGLYPSFETDPRPERLTEAYPPAHLERLRAIKRRHDPDNVFRDNHSIVP
ncbi:FAD/FMN-containing dehydrogenase [Georgenia satyanarayanai]|uniref:FAD/FMN-containing dehydrogenase n=1 Tax=Georgenia satyanarayanai TaxID=860221 RepID=A0A2Y9ANI8_9MICO|nr:LLM class flavin-dependent oxidoreductase [Georgenia satyanarayanai]PYF98997.1 FAD/FMN-containing dehydrogenase [Georgenia satyanarayanai]SSA43959.1 FAD/FMN-containing dehydrogenase [Georgenia satyanarayanai]